ncbi:hypothetical protein TM1040_3805 (plasmid) [Ruegeria sp. TM1040]|uniref:hypothetical protein n=1 Tax=Ruegeria sp. (strain TM1040) TaxID=292414 RepID=UPI0000554042|nr:hypothetical protein [Ruegeria sp. TM1040]ABF61937.1 hypothetical protein TM1040_3805 [Ruegeria sp. TM1040]MDF9301085.1 hypothetical protein [Tritonibacter mobilis]
MRSFLTKFGVSLLCSAGMAQAFCDDILATQVLCLTEDADEIKVCSSQHPEIGDPVLELHVTPQISDGPIYRLAADVPFGMAPGTGGFPWDVHEFSFLHEGGRAVLSVKTPMDTDDTSDAEIWLDLFGRGTAPDRSLSCMQPALSAEIENLLALRRVSMNTMRTGPSADSAPFYQPSKPISGATPHGSYNCREVAGVLSNEGTENGQIALFAAPSDEAAILGYAFPSDLGSAFECVSEDGFSGIIWVDPDKGDGAGGYMTQLDYEARLAACSMTADDWPQDRAYWGNCSSAWVKQGNIAGFGG